MDDASGVDDASGADDASFRADGDRPARMPSIGALLLGLIPFVAMCFSVSLWDRIEPRLIGIPFNLFWLTSWIMLSSLCLWIAYRVEAARDKRNLGIR